MADGGRMNRQAEAQRRTGGAHFFGHEVSCARRPKAGEKSAQRRFHAAAVRHRSIEQKQANGRLASHRSGDRWCGHPGSCDGSSCRPADPLAFDAANLRSPRSPAAASESPRRRPTARVWRRTKRTSAAVGTGSARPKRHCFVLTGRSPRACLHISSSIEARQGAIMSLVNAILHPVLIRDLPPETNVR